MLATGCDLSICEKHNNVINSLAVSINSKSTFDPIRVQNDFLMRRTVQKQFYCFFCRITGFYDCNNLSYMRTIGISVLKEDWRKPIPVRSDMPAKNFVVLFIWSFFWEKWNLFIKCKLLQTSIFSFAVYRIKQLFFFIGRFFAVDGVGIVYRAFCDKGRTFCGYFFANRLLRNNRNYRYNYWYK